MHFKLKSFLLCALGAKTEVSSTGKQIQPGTNTGGIQMAILNASCKEKYARHAHLWSVVCVVTRKGMGNFWNYLDLCMSWS